MSRQERELLRAQKEKAKKRNLTVALSVISAIVVIVAAVFLFTRTKAQKVHANELGHSIGNKDAKVKVIEFSNYSCSHCKNFALNLEPKFIEEYVDTGKVYFQYYPYPWNTSDPTYQASIASYCAAEQNLLFPFKHMLFEKVAGPNDLSNEKLVSYAKSLNMDLDKFNSCMASPNTVAQIDQTQALAKGFNVTGTPSFIVNGRLVYTNQLNEAVEEALKAAN